MVGSAWIFPQLSANSDEGIYLLQADALASGHLSPPAPDVDADAYVPWFAVVRDGDFVLKYTPVYAAILAVGDVAFGAPRAGLALVAAAQVVLVAALARELGARRRTALLAAALFLGSPLVLQLSITFLPYGATLALLLGSALAALRATRTRSRALAAVAGAAWGLLAFARPYDALLGAAAIVLAIVLSERRDLTRALRLAPFAVLGALGPLVLLALFNRAVTGDPFEIPFTLLEPTDRPGFGLRRALPTDAPLDYTPGRALSALGRNLLLVVAWTAGGILTCVLAAAAVARRTLRGTWFLAALLVVWPLGYFFFWGSYLTAFVWDGALFLGPYYYLPMVAALAVAGSRALAQLWDRHRALGVLAGVGVAVLTAGIAVPALVEQRDRTSQRAAVARALDTAVTEPALVFVPPLYGPYLQNPFSFLRNSAEIDGDIVFALERDGRSNARVREAHPDRHAYRLVLSNGWSDEPGFEPQVSVVGLDG